MALTICMTLIILIVVAMTWTEGAWGNCISWINTVFAAIIASNLFEPAANFLDGQFPSLTYFWDFLSLWLIFSLAFAFLRASTDQISETRVRFRMPVETSGRALFGFLTAWTIVCFTVFSLHTAPTKRTSFRKSFAVAPDSNNFILSPDRLWLGFLQSRSEGALARSKPNVFDPKSEFILKYGERRQKFDEMPGMKVDPRR